MVRYSPILAGWKEFLELSEYAARLESSKLSELSSVLDSIRLFLTPEEKTLHAGHWALGFLSRVIRALFLRNNVEGSVRDHVKEAMRGAVGGRALTRDESSLLAVVDRAEAGAS